MNTISTFLYLADVVGNLKVVMVIAGVAALAYMGIWFLIIINHNYDCRYVHPFEKKKPYPTDKLMLAVAFAFTLFGVSALIPTKDTLYLIAASEIDEQVVATPEAKMLMDSIQEVIKARLKKVGE